jgi:WD40 repeat protein
VNRILPNLQLGKQLAVLSHSGFFEYVTAVEFSSDGNLLATGSDANLARVWNWKDGKEIPKFQHGDTVVALGFDRSGTRLASGSDDNTALVWNIDTGREEKRFNLASPVRAVRFSMDGRS